MNGYDRFFLSHSRDMQHWCVRDRQNMQRDHWPRVVEALAIGAVIRRSPDDFRVDEELPFAPCGTGEHAWLKVRKRCRETQFVAKILARHAGVRLRDVSYAGLKDKYALTTQWFSVYLPGRPMPDWAAVADDGVEVLCATRHTRKLKRGALRANRFIIIARELGASSGTLTAHLARIAQDGVPNYFGEQRFGTDNLEKAQAMLTGRLRVRDRFLRGFYFSVLRAWLFNTVLAHRVQAGCWNRAVPGEVLGLAGSRSYFPAPALDPALLARVAENDLHPTGPLWGRGGNPAAGRALALEQEALAPHGQWCTALERAGVAMGRRPLRLVPEGLTWRTLAEGAAEMRFTLPPGAYATALLREALHLR
ncbi:MAG TPA: tRNA pseudouridine(13) synthase TruD [Gammaproteobacteria bacterium]|nr:tRNA pseudouridine(13) synthase TruD [Gammaproteobacteria bacterium]